MKPAMLAALLAAVLAGTAAFAVAWEFRPPPAPPLPDPAVDSLRASLEDARRELAALRARLDEQGSAVPAGGTGPGGGVPVAGAPAGGAAAAQPVPGAAPGREPPGEAMAVAEDDDAESESTVQERESAVRKPASSLEKIRDMRGWDHSNEARQRWMLTPEADVVSLLGKPDEIVADTGGLESWIYRVPNGETDEKGRAQWDDVTLQMSRGRLVRISD